MTEQLLDGSDVVAGYEKFGCERMAQAVAADAFGEACGQSGLSDGALEGGFVEMVTSAFAGGGMGVMASCGENPLPRPFAGGVRVFPA